MADAAVQAGTGYAEAALAEIIKLAEATPAAGARPPVGQALQALMAGGKSQAEAWDSLRVERPLDVAQYALSGGASAGTGNPPPASPPPDSLAKIRAWMTANGRCFRDEA